MCFYYVNLLHIGHEEVDVEANASPNKASSVMFTNTVSAQISHTAKCLLSLLLKSCVIMLNII